MRFLAVFLAVATACSGEPAEGSSRNHGVIAKDGPLTAYIVTQRALTDEEVSLVLADRSVGIDWVRIEVPSLLESYDLAAVSSTVFAQSYMDLCDPSDARRTDRCRLQERYTAGDTGLRGAVSVAHSESELVVMYSVYWEGITTRFDGPSQWHAHETGGRIVVGAGTVRAVDL